jgi:hypothetical protein
MRKTDSARAAVGASAAAAAATKAAARARRKFWWGEFTDCLLCSQVVRLDRRVVSIVPAMQSACLSSQLHKSSSVRQKIAAVGQRSQSPVGLRISRAASRAAVARARAT